MNKAIKQRGRIEEHAEGVGTLTEQTVEERAREIAVTNGRTARRANQADQEQARQELTHAEAEDDQIPEDARLGDTPPGTSHGSAARKFEATDEQEIGTQLVEEGAEEANHERMMQANALSRQKDERFEDQLPEEP